jgi:beta-glucosidase
VTGCLGDRGESSGSSNVVEEARGTEEIDRRVAALLVRMSLEEKIGQMSLVNAGESYIHDYLAEGLRAGRVGGVLNEVDAATVNELQRIAVEESRLGIPLLFGFD